jgi:hypothetical protein
VPNRPGGLAIGVGGPPDPAFAGQLGKPLLGAVATECGPPAEHHAAGLDEAHHLIELPRLRAAERS